MIPYGRQHIDEDDIAAVAAVLRSDWLTQGPAVEAFERALADYTGARFAVVVSNGTAALQAAYAAIGLKPGDEFITSPITFPATSNAAVWQGAKPVFCDIDPSTGNIDVRKIEALITPRTKAIAPIDYTGRPADLVAIQDIAKRHNLAVVEDACQALGGSYFGKKIGSISDLTTFSFHPVKSITTGEGGAILTNNEVYYRAMKKFITHGISRDSFVRDSEGPWYFEMQMLGQNYRLTDMQAALGTSQLKKLDSFVGRRRELVQRYHEKLAGVENITLPMLDSKDVASAWHLFVVRLSNSLAPKRRAIVEALREAGVGAQIHHYPTHWHPYYQSLGYAKELCPEAGKWYESIVSLPLYPDLTEKEQDEIVEKFTSILKSV